MPKNIGTFLVYFLIVVIISTTNNKIKQYDISGNYATSSGIFVNGKL